jgi:hypothetical protein
MAARTSRANNGLPLPSLLSQALVAYTIEFDNEFEHEVPHRTSRSGGSADAPWLASLAMWANFMRFIPSGGISVREFHKRAGLSAEGTRQWLKRLRRWGYVAIAPDPRDRRADPPKPEWLVRPSPSGHIAQAVWPPLFGIIDARWEQRFGGPVFAALRASLVGLIDQFDIALPEYLPILGYGHFARLRRRPALKPSERDAAATHELPLSALLAKVLLQFLLEFEDDSPISLAICANVLRLIPAQAFACATSRRSRASRKSRSRRRSCS